MNDKWFELAERFVEAIEQQAEAVAWFAESFRSPDHADDKLLPGEQAVWTLCESAKKLSDHTERMAIDINGLRDDLFGIATELEKMREGDE